MVITKKLKKNKVVTKLKFVAYLLGKFFSGNLIFEKKKIEKRNFI